MGVCVGGGAYIGLVGLRRTTIYMTGAGTLSGYMSRPLNPMVEGFPFKAQTGPSLGRRGKSEFVGPTLKLLEIHKRNHVLRTATV